MDTIPSSAKSLVHSPNSLEHSPNLVATGTERFNYSVIQGRIRNNNDLVNVIKQKENHLISSPTAFSKESYATTFSQQSSPTTSSKQSSSSYESESSSDDEKKEKIQALPPSKEKECPSSGRKGLSIDATSVHVVEEKVILATRPPSKTLVNGDRVAFNAKNYLRPTKDTKHVMNESSSITLSKQRSPSFE